MIFNIPYTYLGLYFGSTELVYLIINGVRIVGYLIVWIICPNKYDKKWRENLSKLIDNLEENPCVGKTSAVGIKNLDVRKDFIGVCTLYQNQIALPNLTRSNLICFSYSQC